MNPRQWLSRLNRFQHSTGFKVGASIALVLAAIVSFVVYFVSVTAPAVDLGQAAQGAAATSQDGAASQATTEIDYAAKFVGDILDRQADPTSVGVGIAMGLGLSLVIVWLGLTLTYLGLIACGLVIWYPLRMLPGTQDFATLLLGILVLTASFTVLMQAAKLALSGSNPSFAIARNVLDEAVRMKVSLVFIVMLIVALAALPGLMNENSPLRYRVQAFLQYATGGTFWIVALLTLLFGCATLAFEQRDRQIWQTMTKPVSPWRYVLGKWLGIVALNAVLLLVSASAIFMFTDYLRRQTAIGEVQPYVSGTGQGVTEDRRILETQVLTARSASFAQPPEVDLVKFGELVDEYIKEEISTNQFFRNTDSNRAKVHNELYMNLEMAYRAIEPGEYESYLFTGLDRPRDRGSPLTFRYRIDAGSNMPDEIYKLTLVISDGAPIVVETGLGQSHTQTLSPGAIAPDGTLRITVINGDVQTQRANSETISFPPTALEVSYASGGFRANYLRAIALLWVKLAFLAMIAVAAGTFLSFPVACLVAMAIFFSAESANFLTESLEYYGTTNKDGDILWYKVIVHAVASVVGGGFSFYADLKPTTRLVDGKLIPWSAVLGTVVFLAALSTMLFGFGVAVFRRRELAIYSGRS